MRLAIADPPYLERAELWYGGKGRTASRGGRACDIFPGSGSVTRVIEGKLL